MTHVEIVREAINALNKNKHTNITYEPPKDDESGGVNINIKYPDAPWHEYSFNAEWFKAEHIRYEDCYWMKGFKVDDKLRVINPEAVMILRIAWYFYKL